MLYKVCLAPRVEMNWDQQSSSDDQRGNSGGGKSSDDGRVSMSDELKPASEISAPVAIGRAMNGGGGGKADKGKSTCLSSASSSSDALPADNWRSHLAGQLPLLSQERLVDQSV